jgi:hypothetical protein
LAWFLSKEGSEFLETNFLILKLKLPRQKEIKLENKIFGSEIKFKKKLKTTLDFLNDKDTAE